MSSTDDMDLPTESVEIADTPSSSSGSGSSSPCETSDAPSTDATSSGAGTIELDRVIATIGAALSGTSGQTEYAPGPAAELTAEEMTAYGAENSSEIQLEPFKLLAVATETDTGAPSATLGIGDTINVTTVTVAVDKSELTEDEYGIKFTFQLSTPPQGPASLVVQVGDDQFEVPLTEDGSGELSIHTLDPDAYVDPESVTATVLSIIGGNFQDTSVEGATATAQVTDTIDTVTVSLTAEATELEGSNFVTYTASLSGEAVANNAITVTLACGATIIIPAWSNFGTVDVATQGNDVYRDSATVTNMIVAAVEANAGTPGSLEDLQYSDATVETLVEDTIDTATVTLNDVALSDITANGPSGTATITASVNHAAQTDLIIKLDNGATITIAAGQTSGTSTAFPVSGSSFTVAIEEAIGGNYEKLNISDTALVSVGDVASALAKGFWSQHLEAWDGTVALSRKGLQDTTNLIKAGTLTSFDVLPSTMDKDTANNTDWNNDGLKNSGDVGILLGDSNGNGARDALEDTLWVQLEAARQIINSSVSATDARQILMAQAIAAQLNIYNGVRQPADLIGEAVQWLTGAGDVDRDNDGILDLGGPSQDYSTANKSFAGPAVSTNSAAWQQEVQVADENLSTADPDDVIMAGGEDLKNALEYFNTGRLTADGEFAGWTSDGGLTGRSVYFNSTDGFWNTLYDEHKLT